MMKRTRTTQWAAGMAMAALLLLPAAAPAQEASSEAKARAVLDKAAVHLKGNNAFRVEAQVDFSLRVDDGGEELSSDYMVAFERPGKLAVHLENSEVEFQLIAANDTVTTFISEFDGYTVDEGIGHLPDLVHRSAFGPLSPIMLVMAEFVEDEPFADLLDGASDIQYVGAETLNGAATDVVRFSRDELTWNLWVASEGAPVVKRIQPDVSEMIRQFREQGIDASLTVEADLKTWSFGPVAAETFVFTAPAGVEKVASFQPSRPESAARQLLGKPAPDFTLELMDGGTLDLAERKGKEIIVLDFWATWCGPCRQAMPILDRVSEQFADRDVRLYAVNLRETPGEINAFLTGQNLEMTVALDKQGAVAEQYHVAGIPQTVIIDKDGTVQVVHEGVSPTLEQELIRELTALSKGEKLAP